MRRISSATTCGSAVAEHVHGRDAWRFVLHAPKSTVFDGASERLDALLARDQPC